MKKKSPVLLIVACILLGPLLSLVSQPDEANAIPAFARKYRMSCTTCHAPFPRLKDYGDEFAGNGFVLADKDAPRYFVEAGDEKLDLIRELPVAIRMEGFLQHKTVTDREVDFSAPYNVKLLSGGSLTKNIAYYFYFFFSERGEVAGMEDAFVMFNNLFGSELDAYVGQFQISDPLFKRELRLTFDDYEIYRTKVGMSNLNLTYDRGVMLTYGFESGTDVIFEVLSGSGLSHADEFRVYDTDKYKNVAGRISQDIGAHFRVGGFGFYGKEAGAPEDPVDAPVTTNAVWMAGPDMTLTYQNIFQMNLQYLERRDDNPNFDAVAPAAEIETRGAMAEMVYMPQGDRSAWYVTGLFNWVESDMTTENYKTITGHVGHVLKTNFRLILENTYDIENEENQVVVGFIAAF